MQKCSFDASWRRCLCALLAATLAAGCATGAHPGIAKSPEASACSELDAEIRHARESHREALARRQEAWKAVVPVVVAGRYATAQAEAEQTAGRLARLETEARQRGCAPLAG